KDNRFKPQEPLVDIQSIVELAASFGPIAINRAYCNWQFFARYRDALLQNAVELVQLFPPGGGTKNGADIKLCLDAAEDIGRFAHIGTVVIVGGDSDFMPVSQKIKAAGRTLVGIGTRTTTNRHWAKSCHEFRYYENLVEQVAAPASPIDAGSEDVSATTRSETSAQSPDPAPRAADATVASSSAIELLRRAMRLLSEKKGEAWINKAELVPMIKRLDPTFDLKELGHTTSSGWLKTLVDVVDVRAGDHDQQLRLREPQ
ncbi:MAG: NYN domain-containing protein, partial [Ramlibacter sp.]